MEKNIIIMYDMNMHKYAILDMLNNDSYLLYYSDTSINDLESFIINTFNIDHNNGNYVTSLLKLQSVYISILNDRVEINGRMIDDINTKIQFNIPSNKLTIIAKNSNLNIDNKQKNILHDQIREIHNWFICIALCN